MFSSTAERQVRATTGDYTIAISAFSNQSFVESLGTGTLADGFTGLGNLFEGEDLR